MVLLRKQEKSLKSEIQKAKRLRTIYREIKKGYLWNDNILRLASVIIVNNKE